MKIQILLLALVLLAGCNDDWCNKDREWKGWGKEGCVLREETNQTEELNGNIFIKADDIQVGSGNLFLNYTLANKTFRCNGYFCMEKKYLTRVGQDKYVLYLPEEKELEVWK